MGIDLFRVTAFRRTLRQRTTAMSNAREQLVLEENGWSIMDNGGMELDEPVGASSSPHPVSTGPRIRAANPTPDHPVKPRLRVRADPWASLREFLRLDTPIRSQTSWA
jgi:hypothetical protein